MANKKMDRLEGEVRESAGFRYTLYFVFIFFAMITGFYLLEQIYVEKIKLSEEKSRHYMVENQLKDELEKLRPLNSKINTVLTEHKKLRKYFK